MQGGSRIPCRLFERQILLLFGFVCQNYQYAKGRLRGWYDLISSSGLIGFFIVIEYIRLSSTSGLCVDKDNPPPYFTVIFERTIAA